MRCGMRSHNKSRRKRLLPGCILALAAAVFLMGCGESKKAKEARLQGIAQVDAGQWEEAILSFEAALEEADGIVDEFELDILKYRGEAEYRLGDYAAAAHTYGILAEVDEEKPEYLYYKTMAEAASCNQAGVELLEAGQYEEALSFLEAGLSLVEGLNRGEAVQTELAAAFHYNIGAVYEKQGEFAKALGVFQEYVSAYGMTPELEKELAFLESRLDGGNDGGND